MRFLAAALLLFWLRPVAAQVADLRAPATGTGGGTGAASATAGEILRLAPDCEDEQAAPALQAPQDAGTAPPGPRDLLQDYLLTGRGPCRLRREGSVRTVSEQAGKGPAEEKEASAGFALPAALEDPAAVFDGSRRRGPSSVFSGAVQAAFPRARPEKVAPVRRVPVARPEGRIAVAPPGIDFDEPASGDTWIETWARWVDVGEARRQWKRWDIPVVSPVMDFFAGTVQFAQTDARIMGYYGVGSPQGKKALARFAANAALWTVSVPAVPGTASKLAINAAGKLSGGAKALGSFRLVARTREVAGLSYTAREPVWFGLEKVVQGAGMGKGLVHVGIARGYGGLHLGLNFLADTHVYASHIWVGGARLGVPNLLTYRLAARASGMQAEPAPR